MNKTVIEPEFVISSSFQPFADETFPVIHPVRWLHSHFAVGGWSPLQRLNGMLTAHMTSIAPRNGFSWHPHRGLEIYTWVLEGTLYHEDTTGGKGEIRAGELQRMFSGDWIEHQELNLTDEKARAIQIWYVANLKYQGMEQHMDGRLTATSVNAGGSTVVNLTDPEEDLFLYVTDGVGTAGNDGQSLSLNQYDVILASSEADATTITADPNEDLYYMCFYLPKYF